VGETTDAGVRRVLNCLPSPGTENDWRIDNADAAGIVAAPARLPSSVDLRTGWWKVGDQGATGSCVGWACADSVLRWHFVDAGRLPQDTTLAVRFQWMAAKETDVFVHQPTTFIEEAGTSLKAALDVSRTFGAVSNDVLPFDPSDLYDGTVGTFYALATQLKVAAYFNLGRDLRQWRTWLAGNGPILTRLDVDQTWDDATDNDGKLGAYKPETIRGGHAVALVGYTKDSFIVRNSWGTAWGKEGFAFASDQYAAEAFTEAYGVTV
jgi:Papain family cysteine protease